MPDIAKLTVEVTPKGIAEARKQLDELAKAAGGTEKTTLSLMDKFRNMQAVMQGPVAAFGVLTRGMKQLYAAGKELTDLYAVQERAVSNLDAVLKATGGTVGRTSQELQDMASAFQEVTLFGDEAIIGMNAVLLGFRGIQGDQFERTTEAILDMSTIMGTDLVSAANMLGKALDGPTQGISALSRVGFVFTDEQKEMVKVLEESGDLLGAQEIILGEVEKAFGGAARAAGQTATGAFVQLNNAIGDMKEIFGRTIAEGMNPFITKLTEIIAKETELMNLRRDAQIAAGSIANVAGLVSAGKGGAIAGAVGGMSIEMLREAYDLAAKSNPLATTAQTAALKALQDIIDATVRAKVAADEAAAALANATGGGAGRAGWQTAFADVTGFNIESGSQGVNAVADQMGRAMELAISFGDNVSDAALKAQGNVRKIIEALLATGEFGEASATITGLRSLYGELGDVAESTADKVTGYSFALGAAADNGQNALEITEAQIIALSEYELALIAIEVAMQNALKQGYVDSFKAIGEALASGANAGESLAMAFADMGIQMLNQLPMLLLNAGLQAIIANPFSPLGYALVAASGIVAIGAGAANYSRQSVTANALGGVYSSPSLSAYSGQVVSQPTMFAFAKGAGLMGEAGPEAIMPLSRGSDGKLGVKASGSSVSVVVNNNASGTVANASEMTNSDGSKQIIVTVENIMRGAFAAGKMDSSMGRYGVRPQGVRG